MTLGVLMISIAVHLAPQAGNEPGNGKAPELRVWLESGAREACVDVLFVGDGYTEKELGRSGKYWKDVERCSKRLFQERLKATVKWKHFLDLPGASKARWFHEGGYYREHGVFRPWPRCRMRDHEDPFCPVCCEQIARSIQAACGLDWDDAAWHKAHPLSEWK